MGRAVGEGSAARKLAEGDLVEVLTARGTLRGRLRVTAFRDGSELLQLAAPCHPQTLRQIRWANTQIKILLRRR